MKIYSWNVNGIRAVHNKGMFEPFINKHQPDILCIGETKAKQDQSLVDLSEYKEYWNSADKAGYSGTAIFSKIEPVSVTNNIPDKFIKSSGLEADGYGDANKEGRVITAEFDEYYVVTAYTPNVKEDLSRIPLRVDWDKAISAYCKELQKTKPIIYCGDMNVAYTDDDLARPKENQGKKGITKEERAGFMHFLNAGFVDTFRLFHKGNGYYTWWTHWANSRARNVGWRLDYVLVSSKLKHKVLKAEIHSDVMGSDHCPVSIELRI